MPNEHATGKAWPARLNDDYLMLASYRPADSLPATAVRTRSLAARQLLAHAATGGSRSIDELVATAQARPPRWRALRRNLRPGPLSDLARVIALQEILPDDPGVGLSLFDLALDLFGARRIPAENQGVHAQLAHHLGHRDRAVALWQGYPNIPELVRDDLRLDLDNPFLGAAGQPEEEWWRAFRELLPEPHPVLAGATGAPFDRVTAGDVRRISGSSTITVIVTSFQPDEGLITAVRSIIDQSWTNLEILVVDDGSPPECDPLLDRCCRLDNRIRLLKLARNAGTYVARNTGLDAAAGEFVTFQDSDDWSHPGRLERQVRSMLDDSSLVATISDALRVTEELALTRPARNPRILNVSSLMLRKDAVLPRVGYFDSLRKAADSEYLMRIAAAFGQRATRRFRDEPYALIRQAPGSLSRAEVRAGWMHPARIGYRSAYQVWHDQIRAGDATPFMPSRPQTRPFPAPAHLSGGAEPASARCYDVLFASDWRVLGGSQRAMMDEIRALHGRGLRVAIMHLESFLLMSPYRKLLCRPIQRLLNEGYADHVFWSERISVGLAVVQPPPVLQFAATSGTGADTRIRASRTVIVANTAPAALDGRDARYSPAACVEAAAELFGAEPLWCPRSSAISDSLRAHHAGVKIAPFPLPSVVNIDGLFVDRLRPRSGRPVVGRHARDHWTRWPANQAALLGAYPDSPDVDVRIMGGVGRARSLLGAPELPANWLVYEPSATTVRNFLFQLDFCSYFVHPSCAELASRTVLEALAAGCLTVLSPEAAPIYDDAAVYCEPSDVRKLVEHNFREPEAFRGQVDRAGAWVRENHGPTRYAELISTLV